MPSNPERWRPGFDEILAAVAECTAEISGARIEQLSAATRPVQDLGIDSLDLTEWIMDIEDRFAITLPEPDEVGDQIYKQVFTRGDFCLADMVELVQLRWGSGRAARRDGEPGPLVDPCRAGFVQLGWQPERGARTGPLYERVGRDAAGHERLRRRADGMPCVLVPGGPAVLGYEGDLAGRDERPAHEVELSPFSIDLELVSTTAFCRFLNSVAPVGDELLRRWFVLGADDRRSRDQSLERRGGVWCPRPGTDEFPMILVSWHGARAYARWAHGHDPGDEAGPSFLPTEAQWECAVRGRTATRWPSGDAEPRPGLLRAGRAREARRSGVIPLGPVDAVDGLSPFGLRGALGHVWQWCADWYAPDAYARRRPGSRDPEGVSATGVRAERGGSWVGPVSLCRPSYRRGRAPLARGRCLGFRCAAPAPWAG